MNLSIPFAKTGLPILIGTALITLSSHGQPDPQWMAHDRERPLPPVVTPRKPGAQTPSSTAPSDAVVLFDGNNLSQWCSIDGSPTEWKLVDGAMECVKGSGYIRTLRNFGDCQLHIEWSAPVPPEGQGQGRGNSGVFFGGTRYEIQVLDCHENTTYADGSAGSIYGQYPPLVNASLPAGEWQTYDIIFTAPRFSDCGKLISPARMTALHNGVLVQHESELTGPTAWIGRAPYSAHPSKQPISLQDHGNPVRFRNIWVRELGPSSKPEFTLPDALLDRYAGVYSFDHGGPVNVTRAPDGLLELSFSGFTMLLYAESETRFFCKTTDVQCEFKDEEGKQVLLISVGEGWMRSVRD